MSIRTEIDDALERYAAAATRGAHHIASGHLLTVITKLLELVDPKSADETATFPDSNVTISSSGVMSVSPSGAMTVTGDTVVTGNLVVTGTITAAEPVKDEPAVDVEEPAAVEVEPAPVAEPETAPVEEKKPAKAKKAKDGE